MELADEAMFVAESFELAMHLHRIASLKDLAITGEIGVIVLLYLIFKSFAVNTYYRRLRDESIRVNFVDYAKYLD